MAARRKVTREEFDQITCNRCGACCETLWLPSPLKLVEFLGASSLMKDPTPEWIEENDRFIRWLSALDPTGKVASGSPQPDEANHQYCCSRFVRQEDGAGFCTAYEDRPDACRDFPYGQPVGGEDFEKCSWNVEIVSDSPLRSGLRALGTLVGAIGRAGRASSPPTQS